MRFHEFLTEKTLAPTSFYRLSNLLAFIKRLETTGKFVDDKTHKPVIVKPSAAEIEKLKKVADEFPPEGVIVKSRMTGLIPNTIGGVRLSTLFREPEFGGLGGIKGDTPDTSLKPAKLGSIGPAVEVWKAIALFARLTDRTENPVTIERLMSIKDRLNKNMSMSVTTASSKTETVVSKELLAVPELDGKTSDTISVKINVALGSWQRAIAASPNDQDLWGRIQGILKFVNENVALKRYNKIFSQNHRIDPVKIAVVGGEGEKTDVRTSYLDPEQAYKTKKVIPGLTFSLKATSAKIDQSSATTIDGIKTMFRILGLDDSDAVEAITAAEYQGKPRGAIETEAQIAARYRAIQEIFAMAGKRLEIKLSKANDQSEAIFIEHFLSNLTSAMTGGANMTYVDFDAKGTYKKLNPKTIRNLARLINLEARSTKGSKLKGHPYLFVYDKNSGRNLMHVRLSVQAGGRLTLYYELDDLLDMAIEANRSRAKPTV